MRLLTRLAAQYLRARSWLLFGPDEPDPHDPPVMARRLRGQDWQVFAPGVPLPLAPPTLDEAKAIVLADGNSILPLPHLPALGLWVSADELVRRRVTFASHARVDFMFNGEAHRTSVLSFWSWRKRRDARHVAQEIGA